MYSPWLECSVVKIGHSTSIARRRIWFAVWFSNGLPHNYPPRVPQIYLEIPIFVWRFISALIVILICVGIVIHLFKQNILMASKKTETLLKPFNFLHGKKIPSDETVTMLTRTEKPKFVFLNAPTRAFSNEQSEGVSAPLQPEFVQKLMQHYNDRSIEHAKVIAPLIFSPEISNVKEREI